MDKIIDSLIVDPIGKIITICSVFLALHYFKKYSKSIDEKMENLEGLEKKISASVASMKNSFEAYKRSINEVSDKIKDEFFDLKRSIVEYQEEVFKKIHSIDGRTRKVPLMNQDDLTRRVNELERKLNKSNSNIISFSKRVAKEFKKKEQESEEAKNQSKKILENHRDKLAEIEKKIK